MVFQFRGEENHDENYTGSKLQTGNQLFWKKEHLSNTQYSPCTLISASKCVPKEEFTSQLIYKHMYREKKVQFPSVEGSDLFHHGSGTALTSLRYTIAAISTFLALYYAEVSHGVLW